MTGILALAGLLTTMATITPGTADIRLETRYLLWTVGANGRTTAFIDKRTGRNWAAPDQSGGFASVLVDGRVSPCTSSARDGDRLRLGFALQGGKEASATLRVTVLADALVFDVAEVAGDPDQLAFAQAPLALKGSLDEPFAACALARNLRTNVEELPGPCGIVRARAYKRLGMPGASVAVVAGSAASFRGLLKRAVAAAPDIPHSPIGGPWAMDSPANRGSYLFNFGGLGIEQVPQWVALAKAVGARQIDFHGGSSFRFGDFAPDPKTYPNGRADLRAVVDRLHAAGLQAGLHTYAFFVSKQSRYVTPVPDPRLAVARTFTLAEPVDAAATTITVRESTAGAGPTTGFFVANSATLRIGEELVTFSSASQSPPWQFTGCTRGALGTKAAAHAVGEQAGHLKELFGLFLPDAETDLFVEIAANTASTFNECGFDMVYLDALDGSYIHAGPEWAWYYGARFVYELWKRLKKPAIMEMSTFHHHLWPVRSRMGAWDAPHTGFKEFVDMHRVVNRDCARMYLPSHLGWWGIFPWNGVQPDRTLPDDLEYLLCKALADDAGLSFVQGFATDTFPTSEGAQRSAALIRRYEDLRRTGTVPAAVRQRLGEPRAEFTLEEGKQARAFVPVRYDRHVTSGLTEWQMDNRFGAQPLRVRIEALLSPAPPAQGGARQVLGAADVTRLPAPRCADGVTLQVTTTRADGGPGGDCVRLVAGSQRKERRGAWASVEHTLPQPADLTRHGLGVWVRGDGKGEVLNFQLRSPDNVTPGAAEHYVVVDFTGWRYVTFVEPECERLSAYSWPYAGYRGDWEHNPGLAFGSAYKLYHPWVDYTHIGHVGVWLNELPPGETVECLVGPVQALPLADGVVRSPRVTVGGATLTFPVDLQSGHYLEYAPGADAVVYGPAGQVVSRVKPTGGTPQVAAGANAVRLDCEAGTGSSPRARITVITRGRPLRF